MRRPTCTYHCRACGGHFTSLRAFDAHQPGRPCEWPDESGLIEVPGGRCLIGDPEFPLNDVTLYEHQKAWELRKHHGGREAVQSHVIRGVWAT